MSKANMRDADRPRPNPRRPQPRGAGGAGTILIIGLLLGGGALLFVILGFAALVLLKPGRSTSPTVASTGVMATSGISTRDPDRGNAAIDSTSTTGKWIPRVSEKKLQDLMERMRREHGERGESEITEKQVYELMGAPTTRETPVTVRKNGMLITSYEARWRLIEGNTQYETVIVFINGRFGGGIIGGEFTQSKPNKPAPGDFQPAGGGASTPVQLSRAARDLIVGWWDAEIPATYQPNKRRVNTLRLEFDQNGTCRSTEYGERGMSINATQGTWRVEKSEANKLYLALDLRIPLTNEAIAIGNPVLLQFKNDSEWETRGLLGGNTSLLFRKR